MPLKYLEDGDPYSGWPELDGNPAADIHTTLPEPYVRPSTLTYPVNRAFGGAQPLTVPNAALPKRTITPDENSVYSPDDSEDLPDLTSNPVADMSPSGIPAPFANRITGKDTTLQGALETQRQRALEMPVQSVPKWWQRGLAAGTGAVIGGLAGYSNAAKRAAPININEATSSLTNNILHPGYAGKLEAWQSRMNAANEQVQNLGQQVGAQSAAAKLQSDLEYRNDMAQRALGQAANQTAMAAARLEAVTPEMAAASGGLYKIGDKITHAEAIEVKKSLIAQAAQKEKQMTVTDPELADFLKVKPGTPVEQATYRNGVEGLARERQSENYLDIQAARGDPKAIAARDARDKAKAALALASKDNSLRDFVAHEAADRRNRDDLNNLDTKQSNEENKILQQRATDLASIRNNQTLTDTKKQPAIDQINASAASQLQAVKENFRRARIRAGVTGEGINDYAVTVGPDGAPVYKLRSGAAAATPVAPAVSPVAVATGRGEAPTPAKINPYAGNPYRRPQGQ